MDQVYLLTPYCSGKRKCLCSENIKVHSVTFCPPVFILQTSQYAATEQSRSCGQGSHPHTREGSKLLILYGLWRQSFLFNAKEKKMMTVLCISCSAQGRVAGAVRKHPSGLGPGRDAVGELPGLLYNQSEILPVDALLSFQGTIKLDDLLCILQSFAFHVHRVILATV